MLTVDGRIAQGRRLSGNSCQPDEARPVDGKPRWGGTNELAAQKAAGDGLSLHFGERSARCGSEPRHGSA